MLEYSLGTIYRTGYGYAQTPSYIIDEGMALVIAPSKNGQLAVKPSSGRKGEAFVGISLYENLGPLKRRTKKSFVINKTTSPVSIWASEETIYVTNERQVYVFSINDDKFGKRQRDKEFALDFIPFSITGFRIEDEIYLVFWNKEDDHLYVYNNQQRVLRYERDVDNVIEEIGDDAEVFGVDSQIMLGEYPIYNAIVKDILRSGAIEWLIELFMYEDGDIPFIVSPLIDDIGELQPMGYTSIGTSYYILNGIDNTVVRATIDNVETLTLHEDNADPFGLHINDNVLWVGDRTRNKLFAYQYNGSLNRLSGKDIDLLVVQTERLKNYVRDSARITINRNGKVFEDINQNCVSVSDSGEVSFIDVLLNDVVTVEYDYYTVLDDLKEYAEDFPIVTTRGHENLQITYGRQGIYFTSYFERGKKYKLFQNLELSSNGRFQPARKKKNAIPKVLVVGVPSTSSPYLGLEIM